jgi:hypothetical protein
LGWHLDLQLGALAGHACNQQAAPNLVDAFGDAA